MAEYVDVEIQTGLWAAEIVMAVGRGASLDAEIADALRACGAVYCAMLDGLYPEFLARRCDAWLYQLSQEVQKYGLIVPSELLNNLIRKEFAEIGEALVRSQEDPVIRYTLWRQHNLFTSQVM